MPISSGALGWPESYFRKTEEDVERDEDGFMDSGRAPSQTIWTVQLADRDQFEVWKDMRDKKAEKKRKKMRKKKFKEEKKSKKEMVRNDVNLILRRRRRKRFCLLTSVVAFVSTLILLGSIFLFTYFLDEDDLGPAIFRQTECHGDWRVHFLGYKEVLPNGTVKYVCCYMPDVNTSARAYVLQQGKVWPDGYLVRRQDCTLSGNTCEAFENKGAFSPGTPPCSAHRLEITLSSFVLCYSLAALIK